MSRDDSPSPAGFSELLTHVDMAPSVVAVFKAEHDALLGHLLQSEPSLAVSSGQTLAKALLLAGASELEVDIIRVVVEFFDEITSSNDAAVKFVETKALKRQYHTLFNWDGNNANTFFALFGPDFKQYAGEQAKLNPELSSGIRDFLSLGSLRNQLVHGNFAAFSLGQTADEIFALYQSACVFRDTLPKLLRRAVDPPPPPA